LRISSLEDRSNSKTVAGASIKVVGPTSACFFFLLLKTGDFGGERECEKDKAVCACVSLFACMSISI